MDARALYIRTEVMGNQTVAHCQIVGDDTGSGAWTETGLSGAISVSRAMTTAEGYGYGGYPVVLNGQPAGRVETTKKTRRSKAAPTPDPPSAWGAHPGSAGVRHD